jgi:hypothetical protein
MDEVLFGGYITLPVGKKRAQQKYINSCSFCFHKFIVLITWYNKFTHNISHNQYSTQKPQSPEKSKNNLQINAHRAYQEEIFYGNRL